MQNRLRGRERRLVRTFFGAGLGDAYAAVAPTETEEPDNAGAMAMNYFAGAARALMGGLSLPLFGIAGVTGAWDLWFDDAALVVALTAAVGMLWCALRLVCLRVADSAIRWLVPQSTDLLWQTALAVAMWFALRT